MSNAPEQRKLAAIMFTDMVGYSALSQRDDKLALELLEEHRQLLREIFPRFHGTEIKTIGDAFLVEFNSALEAAQCAIAIQRALVKRNADVSPDRRIELKIGIHIGDVVHRGGDVYGDGVNIASRIEPLAGAGGICVSMDVERQIRNAVETRFEKLAPTDLKNISVPMELFRIVLPWERRSEVRSHKSAVSKRVAAPTRRFALIGGLVLLLIIGIGWWWTTLPHKKLASSAPESKQPQNIPEKSIAVLPVDSRTLGSFLALSYAGLGQKEKALEEAKRGVSDYADDALGKPFAEWALAVIEARFGDADSAINALPHLLEVPGGTTPGLLRLDPLWDPLRKDPRFEKLCQEPYK